MDKCDKKCPHCGEECERHDYNHSHRWACGTSLSKWTGNIRYSGSDCKINVMEKRINELEVENRRLRDEIRGLK